MTQRPSAGQTRQSSARSSAGPPELVSSAGEGSSSGAAFTPGGSRSSGAVGSEFFWKGLRGGPELWMFHSADLPELAVECHVLLVTLGRGYVFGQKPFPWG